MYKEILHPDTRSDTYFENPKRKEPIMKADKCSSIKKSKPKRMSYPKKGK